jgi:hypothetical protein
VVRSSLAAQDITTFAGVRVTTPDRTAFDMARRLPLIEAVVAIDAMLGRQLVTPGRLRAFAETRPGWPGTAQLRSVLDLAEPSTESPMESGLRLVHVHGGLPRPVAQYEVGDRDGVFVARLDLAYPARKVGIEYEGDHMHPVSPPVPARAAATPPYYGRLWHACSLPVRRTFPAGTRT